MYLKRTDTHFALEKYNSLHVKENIGLPRKVIREKLNTLAKQIEGMRK